MLEEDGTGIHHHHHDETLHAMIVPHNHSGNCGGTPSRRKNSYDVEVPLTPPTPSRKHHPQQQQQQQPHHRHHHHDFTVTVNNNLDLPHLPPLEKQQPQSPQQQQHFLGKIDNIVFFSYFCNLLVLNLPIILLPVAASQMAETSKTLESPTVVAMIVANASSIATLGGASGKFLGGLLCKRFGPYRCSESFLIGVAICTTLFSFSTTPKMLGWTYAGMEFCASIQWTSLATMLTQYYSKSSPTALTAALTTMGIASPAGAIAAKVFGAALVSILDWRVVARMGAFVAMLGSYCSSKAPIQPFQRETLDRLHRKYSAQPLGSWITSARGSADVLFTSKLFWMLSIAHAVAFVVRGIDRILGTFFSDMTGLPRSLTGGLTLSTTLGLLYGLVSASRSFPHLTIEDQIRMLRIRYTLNVGSALGLAGIASLVAQKYRSPLPVGSSPTSSVTSTQWAISIALALCSGFMSANISYQYFQFPTMTSKVFGEHKEVCISWLDGIAFLLAAPVFAVTGKMVGRYGWVHTWGMLAAFFAAGWTLTMWAIPPVLAKQHEIVISSSHRDITHRQQQNQTRR